MQISLWDALMQYSYLQNAYIAGIIVAFISPIFGVFVISKRVSLIPDTLGHVSFAASTCAVWLISLGILPKETPLLLIVAIFAIATALIISYINHHFPQAKEVALSFVMTFSLGLAIVLYQLSKSKTDLSGYLFGNIVALTSFDVWALIIVAIIALIFMLKYYKVLFISTFDTIFARTKGIKYNQLEILFYIILALIIAASIKFVGVLLVSALMSLPVMIVMTFTKSFKATIIYSIIVSECIMIAGLILSYYLVLPASGVVAMSLGIVFIGVLLIKKLPKFRY